MRVHFLIFLFSLLPSSLLAQSGFKPVIDSSAACSYHRPKVEFQIVYPSRKPAKTLIVYYIVHDMPFPQKSPERIRTILKNDIRGKRKIQGSGSTVHLQCLVNCKGIAGDYQILSCPEGREDLCSRILRSFKNNVKRWEPGKLHGLPVDVIVNIIVEIRDNEIYVMAPVE